MSIDRLRYFVSELISSQRRRESGQPFPWTDDLILRDGKFCRPRVEDDRTSRAIAKLRDSHADDPDLIVAVAIWKRLNNAEAIEALGYPSDLDAFYARLIARDERGEPCMNQGAYNAIGGGCPKGVSAVVWLTKVVFPALWSARKSLRPCAGDTCASVHARLMTLHGWGGFLAAQVVNCLKYAGPLRSASDWWSFAASGPGSRPGLNYVLGRDPKAPWPESAWRAEFDKVYTDVIRPEAARLGVEFSASDGQSICCEFSKFMKWTAAGKPGRRYTPPHLRRAKATKKPKAKPSAPIPSPASLPSAPPAPPVTYVPQPDAPVLFVDVETRSTINLLDTGAHRYAAHPTTEVLCIAYAVDDGPMKIWRRGEPVPQVFVDAARDPRWRVVAHNAEFERAIMRHILVPRHGFPIIPTKRWRCTMATALAAALPGALENVAAALGLPHQKDLEGRNLMLRMCRPLYIEAGTGKPVWLEDAEYIERLCQYCACDVDVERALFERLPPLSDEEQRVWRLDQRINKRGFHVDRELAQAARAIAEREQKAIGDEISALTDGEITRSGCARTAIK
jgi:alpha-glutamyl/putrescinyl thymine pyrophosphorylase clade 1